MPFKPFTISVSLSITSLLGGQTLVHDNLSDFLDASLFADAFRFEEIDGADIVNLSRFPTATPLFFPKVLSLHDCMDTSSSSFYSLEDLARNPSLVKIQSKKNKAWVSPNTSHHEKSRSYARDSRVFDASQLLIPSQHQALASDEQLEKFLARNQNKLPDAETQKRIIENLLKDEYADQSIAGFLGHAVREKLVPPTVKGQILNRTTAINAEKRQPLEEKAEPVGAPQEVVVASKPLMSPRVNPPMPNVADRTKLNLVAHKPLRDGTLQPAQASEIYLTTRDLRALLTDLTNDPAVAGEVRSVAELWAKAEKNVSRNPEIALGVKSILLSAKVGRARTDPYGQASLENLSPDDKYYVIGIDKDVETNVVTIWSKEVEVEPGENLVELTSTDVIYQE